MKTANSSSIARTGLLKRKVRAVPRASVCEEVTDQIIGLIADGELKPGDRLPSERELCELFQVGRSSLREALRCLSIVGMLDAKVGGGTTIAVNNERFLGRILEWRFLAERNDVENMMEVRMALEGATAASMARRAGHETIDELQRLIEKMSTAVEDRRSFTALDTEFHLLIARASGNALLSDLVHMIRGQLGRSVRSALQWPDALPLSYKEHLAIFNSIKAGDAEQARSAMYAHLTAAVKRFELQRAAKSS